MNGYMRPPKVCLCRNVPKEFIAEKVLLGYDTIEKIVEVTRATTGCGTCSKKVQAVIDEVLENTKILD